MKRLMIVILMWIAVGPAVAERVWTKDHTVIQNPGQGIVTEYTSISNDPALPFTYRRLLKVGDDLVVIRATQSDESGSYVMTIASVASGETLTIESDFEVEQRLSFGVGTLVVGFDEFSTYFAANQDYPPAMRSAAATLIGNVSTEFRDALHALAKIGCYHSIDFSPLTMMLNVFFDDLDFTDPSIEKPSSTSQKVKNFDPLVTPPAAFEEPFGQAYFE